MAAGEGHPDTLRCDYLRTPLASLWVQKDFFFMPEENPADQSDACSDSGSERDENSRNVVKWLESLPTDNQWYEAEEQIGRLESSEAVIRDGISTIGDTDAPITLKSLQASAESRAENIEVKKVPKSRKYRKGTLHANSATNEKRPERKKKSLSRERRATSSKKSCASSVKVPSSGDSREKKCAITACRPNFRKPEVGRFLDEAMSMAIKKYKRNERSWEECSNNGMEPPAKKPKSSENLEKTN